LWVLLLQEGDRGLDSGFCAGLRPQPDGEVVMLSSTLSEDEDLDLDSTDYSHYASTGALSSTAPSVPQRALVQGD
jgi:hypothetical protein